MKKYSRILPLVLAVVLAISCSVTPAFAIDTTLQIPFSNMEYQNGFRSTDFDTPSGYDANGNPIYHAREVTQENGETVYTVVMPIYSNDTKSGRQLVEIPGVAWLSAKLIRSAGGSAELEIVYNCFMLAFAKNMTVQSFSTTGDLGSRNYPHSTSVVNAIAGPYISITKMFSAFNSYITNGTQWVSVGAMTCGGPNLTGSAPPATIAFDIAKM